LAQPVEMVSHANRHSLSATSRSPRSHLQHTQRTRHGENRKRMHGRCVPCVSHGVARVCGKQHMQVGQPLESNHHLLGDLDGLVAPAEAIQRDCLASACV
jgi:hypothetical protein